MLNKKLCHRCFKKYWTSDCKYPNTLRPIAVYHNGIQLEFEKKLPDAYFEEHWKKYNCLCHLGTFKHAYKFILEKPPTDCPYLLEHTITEPVGYGRFKIRARYFWHRHTEVITMAVMLAVLFTLLFFVGPYFETLKVRPNSFKSDFDDFYKFCDAVRKLVKLLC
jgi:hypothetical protein